MIIIQQGSINHMQNQNGVNQNINFLINVLKWWRPTPKPSQNSTMSQCHQAIWEIIYILHSVQVRFWVNIFFKSNSSNKTYIYKLKKLNKHCISLFQSEFNLKCNIILFNPQQTSFVSLRCSDAHHALHWFQPFQQLNHKRKSTVFHNDPNKRKQTVWDLMCWAWSHICQRGLRHVTCYMPRTFNHTFAVLWGVLLVYMACPTEA